MPRLSCSSAFAPRSARSKLGSLHLERFAPPWTVCSRQHVVRRALTNRTTNNRSERCAESAALTMVPVCDTL
jgi:hypothetical protein